MANEEEHSITIKDYCIDCLKKLSAKLYILDISKDC